MTAEPWETKLTRDLIEWIRIPSVSTTPNDREAIGAAAEWACEKIVSAGGTASVLETYGNPLAIGELRSGRADAPEVLIYGHHDVQAPGRDEDWTSPPFEPEIRNGRIYGRGASDDKGNFLPALYAACELARTGALAVNIHVLLDGEEETSGTGAPRWLSEHAHHMDCALVFDGEMMDEQTPAIVTSSRGLVKIDLTVTVADSDLHSGSFGGSSLNAAHVLHQMLEAVLPDADGRLRPELRRGIATNGEDELQTSSLPPGEMVLAEAGARELYSGAGADYYRRNWTDTCLDVNWINVGAPRTVLPGVARAMLSQRLAPGQNASLIGAELERLLRNAAPNQVDVVMTVTATDPAVFDPHSEAMQIAASAINSTTGKSTLFVGAGGTLPVMAQFASMGLPAILTGFALPQDRIHAPNESFRLESLRLAYITACSLYKSLAALRSNSKETRA